MIPVNEPRFTDREKELLNQCIDTAWVSSEGTFVGKFEQMVSHHIGLKHGIAVSSGTAALDLAVAGLGLDEGDRVLLPSFTIISCALAVVKAGLIPVLVDADPSTWCMDMNSAVQIISKDTRIKAVMPVHIYGVPCEMEALVKIARERRLHIIEDAAEAHGALYNGRPCGSFGDISVLSFYANKLITTGEGGMCLTNDKRLASRIQSLRNLCFRAEKRFEHHDTGFNYRMTNLQAAIGVAQMERVSQLVDQKKRIGQAYNERLSKMPGIRLQKVPKKAESIYWVNGLVLDENLPIDAGALAEKLSALGVQTRPFFWPMHEQPVFMEKGLFQGERYPVAEMLGRRGLYLPSGMAMTVDKVNQVCDAVAKVLNKII